MTLKQTFAVAVSGVALLGGVARAQGLPANVQNIRVTQEGTAITVTWDPVTDASFYRVYFSHESILENDGNYDDFERTKGAETTLTFPRPPLSSEKIFFSVLAASSAGAESEGFETEAFVGVQVASSAPAVSSASSSASSVATASTTSIPLTVKSVEAISSTGVLVTFSKKLRGDANTSTGSFRIANESGVVLAITRVEMTGATLLIHTETQKPEETYAFRLMTVLPAEDGTNATPNEPAVSFTAFGSKTVSSSRPYGSRPGSQGSSPTPAVNPAFLNLTAALRKDGMYNVTAVWGQAPGTQAYGLYTSGNGEPYKWNAAVPAVETSARYDGIRPGTFGLRVTSRTEQSESSGIEKAIVLPASGIGFLGIAGIAGAIAARRKRKLVG